MHRPLALLFPIFAAAILFVGCKEERVIPVPAAGEIAIEVLARESVETPAGEYKSVGGIVNAVYTSSGDGIAYSRNHQQSFTGSAKIPAQMAEFGVTAELTSLEILSVDGKRLSNFDGSSMRELVHSAKTGVRLEVVVTLNGGVQPELRIIRSANAPEEPKYKSIKDVFPNPQDILTLPDTNDTLTKLKSIASPTGVYHKELIDMLKEAKTVDVAHLKLLLEACYFTRADQESLIKELQESRKQGDSKRIGELEKELYDTQHFGRYAAELLEAGLPKTSDLTVDSALTLLAMQFAGISSDAAFQHVADRFAPLSSEAKLALMNLAIDRQASTAAAKLGKDWFENDSDRSVKTLLELARKFSYNSKDELIVAGMKDVSDITAEESITLVNASYDAKLEIADLAFGKIRNPVVADLVQLVTLLSYNSKDKLLQKNLGAFRTVTFEEAASLITASYDDRFNIGSALIPKIAGLDGAGAIKLAGIYNYNEKDKILHGALKVLGALTMEETAGLIRASYDDKLNIGLAAFAKVPNERITAAGIAELMGLYSYNSKDQFLFYGLKRLRMISVKDLLILASASYDKKAELILEKMNQTSDLNAANAVKLAAVVSYNNKDKVIANYLKTVAKIKTADLLAVAVAAYDQTAAFIVDSVGKVSDLTVANAISLVDKLTYNTKDKFLLVAVDLVTDLSTGNLMTLANASYDKKQQIIEKGLQRLSR